MGRVGRFESKEKTRKRNRDKRKGCLFEFLIMLLGVAVTGLLNITDDTSGASLTMGIGFIALVLICGVCSGVYGIYKMIRKRKDKKRTSPEEDGTAKAVTGVGRFERVPPHKSMNRDS